MVKDMTWGKFKAKVEEKGVTDDMTINWIDWTGCAGDPDRPGESNVSVRGSRDRSIAVSD